MKGKSGGSNENKDKTNNKLNKKKSQPSPGSDLMWRTRKSVLKKEALPGCAGCARYQHGQWTAMKVLQ